MKKQQQAQEINIVLTRFKMSLIKNNKILVFIGKRNTGKSVLVIDYLYYNQDIPFCTCISPTDDYNLTFRPHIPSRFIFDTYTPDLLDKFLKRQKKIKQRQNHARAGYGDPKYKDIDCRGLLIMDDCLSDSNLWKKDSNLRWVFLNGRHIDITFILTMQYQLGISPEFRMNIDYIFICKETKVNEINKLYTNYAGMFINFDMFRQIFNQVTDNYGCLVIDNTTQSAELSDQVFTYRATLHDKNSFRVCYEDFWINNNDYINKSYLEDEDALNDLKKLAMANTKIRYFLK
jgi:hypothetical protein